MNTRCHLSVASATDRSVVRQVLDCGRPLPLWAAWLSHSARRPAHSRTLPRQAGRFAVAARTQSAFTMVEIALSLAIIGIGMVAVIGVLPRGLEVQRENRQETIINQDASVWLNAIRSGARGYDDLTNYVDAITNIVTGFDADGNVIEGPDRYGYTWTQCSRNNTLLDPRDVITNGTRIIGLLSTPKISSYYDLANKIPARSNYVTAYVRSISGAASEKFPQANASVRELAFSYRMVSEMVPYTSWDTNLMQLNVPGLSTNEWVARSNAWTIARNTHANLHDIRLLFRWPLLPRGGTGNGRQAFRAAAGGDLVRTTNGGMTLYFFTPRTYVRNP